MYIQSNKEGPFYLDDKIEEFLDRFYEYLKQLPIEAFNSSVDALISQTMETPKTMGSEHGWWSGAIRSRFYNFQDEDLKYVRALAEVKKEDLVTLFEKYIKADAPERTKFVCGAYADEHAKALFGESFKRPDTDWHGPEAFSEDTVKSHVKSTEARGKIVCVTDPKLFRDNAEYYRTLREIEEANL